MAVAVCIRRWRGRRGRLRRGPAAQRRAGRRTFGGRREAGDVDGGRNRRHWRRRRGRRVGFPGRANWRTRAGRSRWRPRGSGWHRGRGVRATPEARSNSTRWPRRPKPVTSVQPVAPWSRRMRRRASWIRASRRCRHRSSGPVLRGAFRRRRGRRCRAVWWGWAFGSGRGRLCGGRVAGPTRPLQVMASAGTAPSAECPPEQQSAHGREFGGHAAEHLVESFLGASAAVPNGTRAAASALCGSAPMAKTSLNPCSAAIRPKTNGSLTRAGR